MSAARLSADHRTLRGTCHACGTVWALRADGTIREHRRPLEPGVWTDRPVCVGSGLLTWPDR